METNLFAGIAAGYASSRPPVHPVVLERLASRGLPIATNALDIGCGAGLSTRALAPLARHAIGLEPAEAMLKQTRTVAPGSSFVVGRAEALPMANRGIDLMTAAGSLNYAADLPAFFSEARRVLTAQGHLLVYDFSAGRVTSDWFRQFMDRYPRAKDNAVHLDPALVAEASQPLFTMPWFSNFRIPLTLGQNFYVDYMMTETNVADAIHRGAATEAGIREWCVETLAPIFDGQPREIVFEGYMAVLQ